MTHAILNEDYEYGITISDTHDEAIEKAKETASEYFKERKQNE